MPGPLVTFSVQDGEIVSPAAGWVYVWRETGVGDRAVIYVGATALHPVARAEKHLRDPDPLVGRIRARFAAAGGDLARPLTVHAVAVASGGRRALVKAMVAWRVSASGLLSPHYCGDPPALLAETLSPDEEACVRALVASR